MHISTEPKGQKRPLSADLNLVPYIDLLTCMVAFLLITAVWTQLAQLKTTPHGPGGDNESPPPTTKIAIVVSQDNINLVVNEDREILADRNEGPDLQALSAALKKAKHHFPDKDDVQIASADNVVFDRLTGIMDVTIAAGFPDVSLTPGGD